MAVAGAPWQLECENLEQRCGYLLTSGLWSDCTLMVGSETNQSVMPVHKLILAMASPVFEALLYGGLSERNDPIVSIPDVEPEAFRALLQYIYTANINIESFDMACNLWYGAKKYMLPHLVKQCVKYICTVVGPSNACRTYELACLFDEKTVMDKCIQIISTNTKEVLYDSSFEDVELQTVITVCSLDHLNVNSELDLFHAVARYADAELRRQGQNSCPKVLLSVENSFQTRPATELDSKPPTEVLSSEPSADREDVKENEHSIHAALQKIRFLSLTSQEFAEGPARSDLLTKEESLAILINIASTDRTVPMPTGFSENRERRKPRSDSDAARAAVNIEHGTRPNAQQPLDKGILGAQGPALTDGNDRSRNQSRYREPSTSSSNTLPRFKCMPSSAIATSPAELYQKYSPLNYMPLTQRLQLQQHGLITFKPCSLDHTINALKCGRPSEVQKAVLAVKHILCTPLGIQSALVEGILEALVPALTEGDDACKSNAAMAIYKLCALGSPSQLGVLAASAALQPYCRLLTEGGETCNYTLFGLTALLKNVELMTKPALLRKLRDIGAPQLLITVREGGNEHKRELADLLLSTYFSNDQ